jgi:D-alanyl-D-alanine carboxypeptidase
MPVADADRDLPLGFAAADLGEACSKGSAHLISEHTAPLLRGRVNAYVIFVLGSVAVRDYAWTITSSAGMTLSLTTEYGRLRWRPEKPGIYTITVEIGTSGGVMETLQLRQEVQAVPETMTALHKIKDERFTTVGDHEAGIRVACDLLSYITAAGKLTGGTISARLLSAVAYTAMVCRGPRTSAESLYPSNLNAKGVVAPLPPESAYTIRDCTRPSGVCRITPGALALHLGSIKFTSPEIPTVGALRSKYAALPERAATDTFNLLRFPKTNLRMAAAMLASQRAQWQTAIESSSGKVVGDHDLSPRVLPDRRARPAVAEVATVFAAGGMPFARLKPKGTEKDAPQYLPASSFGLAVESNFLLPLLLVLVEPDAEAELYCKQWDMRPESLTADVARAEARRHFGGGKIHYVSLAFDYKRKLNEDDMLTWILDNIKAFEDVGPNPGELGLFVRPKQPSKPSHPEEFENAKVYLNRALIDGPNGLSQGPLPLALKAARSKLPTGFAFKNVDGFCPRRREKDGKLSNHALGRAIDIDPESNPWLHKAEMEAINYLLKREVLKVGVQSKYAELQDARSGFLRNYELTLVGPTASEIEQTPISRVQRQLNATWLSNGFLTIPEAFVRAMIANGFGWGGYYPNSRDLMHFEIPPEYEAPE